MTVTTGLAGLPERFVLSREPLAATPSSFVWLAEDRELGRPTVVKVLRGEAPPEVREAFVRGNRTMARFRHENVAVVFDVGRLDDDRPWVALEYLPRGSLARLSAAGPLPVSRAVEIAVTLADVLHLLHVHLGTLHRDVKPGNVLVRESGAIVLTDLGIAAEIPDGAESVTTWQFSEDYAAPEVRERRRYSAASEVYSLGVTLGELLCGTNPWARRDAASGTGSDLPEALLAVDLPPVLRDALCLLTAPDPAGRPADMATAAAALRDVQRALGGPVTPPAAVPQLSGEPSGAGPDTGDAVPTRTRARLQQPVSGAVPADTGAPTRLRADASVPGTPSRRTRPLVTLALALGLVAALAGTATVAAVVATSLSTATAAVEPSTVSAGAPAARSASSPPIVPSALPPAPTPAPTSPTSASPPSASPPSAVIEPVAPPTRSPVGEPAEPSVQPRPEAEPPAPARVHCVDTVVRGSFSLGPGQAPVAGGPNFTSDACTTISLKLTSATYVTWARACLETSDGGQLTRCGSWVRLSYPDTWDLLLSDVPAGSRWQLQMYGDQAQDVLFFYTA